MSAKQSPGKRLVDALTSSLPDNREMDKRKKPSPWMRSSPPVIGFHGLRARFDVSERDPSVTENRLALLPAEIRLLEEAINRWARSLNSDGTEAKSVSAQHQRAAHIRCTVPTHKGADTEADLHARLLREKKAFRR